jgi:hypothetical protein
LSAVKKAKPASRRSTSLSAGGASVSAGGASLSSAWPPWLAPTILLLAALVLFYAAPLLSPQASIQWDAIDVHYSAQRYLVEELWGGNLPLWTPYLYSGFPFLADPQVGAFYPLNWPFLLAGAGPKLIQAELVLHAALALAGMFLFLRLHCLNAWPAALGAIAYALSGYFAGHASHVGMFQAACLLPWLLYCAGRALGGRYLRWLGAAGGIAGMMFLAGHLQNALYGCAALALYLTLRTALQRRLLPKAAGLLAGIAALAFLLAAVMVLPGLELAAESVRSTQDFSASDEGALRPAALFTLLFPDALGSRGDQYRGPGDRTQTYFYGGLLLLPLALFGALRWRHALLPLLLLLLPLWFMLGPDAGLYRIAMAIPWLSKVRAPIHAWFVVAFALAWLAALGAARLSNRISWQGLGLALCLVMALDLAMVNSWNNPLTYSRVGFAVLHERGAEVLRTRVAPNVPAGLRFAAVDQLAVFGSMNSPLQVRLETTYGYNPLELRRYAAFRKAAEANPLLMDALGAAITLDLKTAKLASRTQALPKAWFPAEVQRVDDEAAELQALATLNPAAAAVISNGADIANLGATPDAPVLAVDAPVLAVDAPVLAIDAQVLAIDARPTTWRIRYRAAQPALLALSLPHYPGWSATVNGQQLPLLRVNHALSGLALPAGEQDVQLQFHSTRLGLGAILSLLGLLLVGLLCVLPGRRPSSTSPAPAVVPVTSPPHP